MTEPFGIWVLEVEIGGSVARCDISQNPPESARTRAKIMPATGLTLAESTVARIGPIINTTSSSVASIENAVCNCAGLFTATVQRERTIEPSEPEVAPDIAVNTYKYATGACNAAATIKPNKLVEDTETSGIITRACPKRSTKRATNGAQTANAIMLVAATWPANVYEPYSVEIIKICEIPTIDMGKRAIKPASENFNAPGIDKISR